MKGNSDTANNDLIDFIAEFNNWIYSVDIEGFAVAVGKNPRHAHTDCWVVEKFEKLKKTPLELFGNFDRGHQALLLRAIDGCTKNAYETDKGNYEYEEDDYGVFVSVTYTVEHDPDYGADSDGKRGVSVTSVLVENALIHCNGIDVTAYFDACEIDPENNDSLHDDILEYDKGRHEEY